MERADGASGQTWRNSITNRVDSLRKRFNRRSVSRSNSLSEQSLQRGPTVDTERPYATLSRGRSRRSAVIHRAIISGTDYVKNPAQLREDIDTLKKDMSGIDIFVQNVRDSSVAAMRAAKSKAPQQYVMSTLGVLKFDKDDMTFLMKLTKELEENNVYYPQLHPLKGIITHYVVTDLMGLNVSLEDLKELEESDDPEKVKLVKLIMLRTLHLSNSSSEELKAFVKSPQKINKLLDYRRNIAHAMNKYLHDLLSAPDENPVKLEVRDELLKFLSNEARSKNAFEAGQMLLDVNGTLAQAGLPEITALETSVLPGDLRLGLENGIKKYLCDFLSGDIEECSESIEVHRELISFLKNKRRMGSLRNVYLEVLKVNQQLSEASLNPIKAVQAIDFRRRLVFGMEKYLESYDARSIPRTLVTTEAKGIILAFAQDKEHLKDFESVRQCVFEINSLLASEGLPKITGIDESVLPEKLQLEYEEKEKDDEPPALEDP